MKHLFKPQFFKGLLTVLVLLLMVKVLWFAVQIVFLPTIGINHAEEGAGEPLYYKVKLTPNESTAPAKQKPKPVKSRPSGGSIDDIKLLALYHASDMTIATVTYKGKSKVLSRGDNISGFVLEGGGQNFVTFSKGNKTYTVMLSKNNKKSKNTVKASNTKSPSPAKEVAETLEKGSVTDAGDHKVIDRSLLDHYAKNMKDIYKNIGIAEVKDGDKLKGFRLTFVRKDSDFAKLGVKRNDVIKSINGQAITSYNAAFGVYKNIQKADALTMVIERGNEEMELEYEIN
jgi:general secretion pathway protein C